MKTESHDRGGDVLIESMRETCVCVWVVRWPS